MRLVGAGKSVRSDLRLGLRAIIGYPRALAREPFLLLEQLPARHAATSSVDTSAPVLSNEWGVSGSFMYRLSAVAEPAMPFFRVAPGTPAYAVRFVARRHQELFERPETAI